MSLPIWCFTLIIHPFISGFSLVSSHLSHSCNTFQLSITLYREPLRTVHLVGRNVLKPGNSEARSSINFLNNTSRFGENFSLKYYSNSTLNSCVFEPVSFGVVIGNSHWKSQISNTTQNMRLWKSCGHSWMKRFPLHLWQKISFLCNGEDTKFRFEWSITCP